MLILTNTIICIAAYDTISWFFSLVCCRQQIKNSAVYGNLNWFEILLHLTQILVLDAGMMQCGLKELIQRSSFFFFCSSNLEPELFGPNWGPRQSCGVDKYWKKTVVTLPKNQHRHVGDLRESITLHGGHGGRQNTSLNFFMLVWYQPCSLHPIS